jgi:ribonucleoside-diphosphate reductase alpha chain
MGLGVTAVANTIEAFGRPYGTPSYVSTQSYLLSALRDATYSTSVDIARVKGAFPMFDADKYGRSPFIQTLPSDIQSRIRGGIRNSHLLSIAPTGTISYCADNVSSGIEPVFATSVERQVTLNGEPTRVDVRDYGVEFLGVTPKTADQVTVDEHVEVLCNAQAYIDSAVSKTCNVGADVSWESFKNVYIQAYLGGAKGCTVYRVGGKRDPILVAKEPAACRITPDGRKECGE